MTIETSLADFVTFDLLRVLSSEISSDAVSALRYAIAQICSELLPEAIGLTDAFGFSDWELNRFVYVYFPRCRHSFLFLSSALGRYDGKAYQTLWEKSQLDPLNEKEVPDAYEVCFLPTILAHRVFIFRFRSQSGQCCYGGNVKHGKLHVERRCSL